jgi:outer membrane protein assembly factor BamB
MTDDAISTPASDPTVSTHWKPLRIWPPVILLVGMIVFRLLPSLIEDAPANIWMSSAFGPAICGILILIWWVAASRATALERIFGFLGIVLSVALTLALIDITMRGPAVMVLTIPSGTAAFALGAILCHRLLSFKRTVVAVMMGLTGFGISTLFRSDGMWGSFSLGLQPRWASSSETLVLKKDASRSKAVVGNADLANGVSHPEWPGFRGPNRDGVQHGPLISTDWNTNQPQLVWKNAIGPGWSSFAVAGRMIVTQEQRGAFETVVSYAADSGLEIWTRQVESRFDDPMGGPGPRATPTFADGGLYVMGATGFLLRLDPLTGDVVWQQDLRQIADRKPPMWGFSSSPLVVGSVVIVHAGGPGNKGILAFNIQDGKVQWSAASGNDSYGSPQLMNLDGEPFVVMLTNTGMNLLDPASGESRMNYEWVIEGYRALQPQLVGIDSVLIPSGMGNGTRRIRVSRVEGQLKADEVWTSRNLKPEFNDLVVYEGHAYGFDSALFSCIDLETGQRNWKGGRYGKGQVLLLNDQGLLLVMGEQGEVVLLKADSKVLNELGRFQALTGKTWNHPVLIGDRLYVRNSQEAACYRLTLAE